MKTLDEQDREMAFAVDSVCDVIEWAGYLAVIDKIVENMKRRQLAYRRKAFLKKLDSRVADDSDTDPYSDPEYPDPFDDREPRL